MISSRKKIYIIGGILAAILIIVMLASLAFKDSNRNTQNTTISEFRINGINRVYYGLPENTQTAITESIEQYLSVDEIKTENLEGHVREGSFLEKKESDSNTRTLLVDIPKVKRTYKVNYSTGTDGRKILYILCPSGDERIYPEFNCRDDLSE